MGKEGMPAKRKTIIMQLEMSLCNHCIWFDSPWMWLFIIKLLFSNILYYEFAMLDWICFDHLQNDYCQ